MIYLDSVLVLLGHLDCMDCIDAYMKTEFLAKSILFADITFGVYTKSYEYVYYLNDYFARSKNVTT